MTLEEAQAALVLAQQEVVDATTALQTATDNVISTTVARDEAQTGYTQALAAYEATKVTVPGTASSTTQNVVQNGTFDSAAGWSNVVNSTTVYTGGASPIAINGKLKGSYTAGIYIQQTGIFPSPTRQVTFGVDVWNYDTNEGNRIANPDYYRIEFRTYNAAGTRLNYYNLEISQWHDSWITRGGTYTLSDDAVRWDVGFRMQDGGYWAGAFGPEIDNVRVIATMATVTPTTYTYGATETAAKDAAYSALQTAQASLASANIAKTQAQTRLNTAVAEVSRLEALVIELTPHINAPTGLTAVINGENVDLSWTAPVSNLSGVQVERYDISWSTTNFVDNGWGWNHDQTSISIPLSVLNQYGGLGSTFQFAIRADNNTLHVYSPRSTFASVQTVSPPWWQISFNENDMVSISTPSGYVFDAPRAWYGSPTDPTCGVDVSSIVAGFIAGNSLGSFAANNTNFTDPCPGVGKVLRLSTPIVIAPVVTPVPDPTPSPVVDPTPTPGPPVPTEIDTTPVTPIPDPSPGPTPEPIPVTPAPEPTPEPTQTPSPTPEPVQTPVIIVPEPVVIPEPVVTPTPTPTEEPVVVPTPESTVDSTPTPTPTEEPTPTPTETQEPAKEPTKDVVQPTPTSEPLPTPEVQREPELPVNIETVDPKALTETQVEQLVSVANEILATAEQGSPAYEQALQALAVAAEADDPEISAELAAIPLLGDVAGAALEVFNNLGNVGADMAPAVREEAKKTVIASVIAAGAAVNAVAAASMASSGTTGGSSSGGSSGGSGSTRRKE